MAPHEKTFWYVLVASLALALLGIPNSVAQGVTGQPSGSLHAPMQYVTVEGNMGKWYPEILALVRSGESRKAWDRVFEYHQLAGEDAYTRTKFLLLLAQISLDSADEAIPRERLPKLVEDDYEVVAGENQRIDFADSPALRAACGADLVRGSLLCASLLRASGDDDIRHELLNRAALLASTIRFQSFNDQAWQTMSRDLLEQLVIELVSARETRNTVRVLQGQWEFMFGELAVGTISSAEKDAILLALAEARAGDLFKARGDLPEAAKCYVQSKDTFDQLGNLPSGESARRVLGAMHKVKTELDSRLFYGPWLNVEPVRFQDQQKLENDLLALFNAYSVALATKAADEAAKYFHNGDGRIEEMKSRRKYLMGYSISSIRYKGILGVSMVPAEAKSITITAVMDVEFDSGEVKEFRKQHMVVLLPSGWAIER